MRDVYVIGAHTIKFGKYLDKSVKDLAASTVTPCLKETGLDKKDIQALWFSNSGWGRNKGQDTIRGQVALRPMESKQSLLLMSKTPAREDQRPSIMHGLVSPVVYTTLPWPWVPKN